jgi:hypothetical protein
MLSIFALEDLVVFHIDKEASIACVCVYELY